MRIGVFGGTFDPVHLGHLAAAEAARVHGGLDRVLFVPAARPPHKPESVVGSTTDRLAMVGLAIDGHPRFACSDVEVRREGPSFTVDTVEALQSSAPDDEFVVVVGSDSLLDLPNWREPERLCRLATFIALVRPGWPRTAVEAWIAAQPAARRPRALLVDGPALDVASSGIRRLLASGASVRFLVPDAVHDYIVARGLYGVTGSAARHDRGGSGAAAAGPADPPPASEAVWRAVSARLSPARAAHCARVADTAADLAAAHGMDESAARLAGLLHDWCREVPGEVIARQARALGVDRSAAAHDLVPAALHGPVAARVLPAIWPGLPAEVLSAIDRHTTGDPAMTAFDCLVFLADMTEPAHRYDGVEALREAARRDLRSACAQGLTATLALLIRRGVRIEPRAVSARNALLMP